MPTEIIEHAGRILCTEPSRMLSLRLLCERTCRELGIEISGVRLLRLVQAHPERFAVIQPAEPLLEGWNERDVERYGPELEAAGFPCGAHILLITAPEVHHGLQARSREPEPLDRLLEDVHSAVTDLLRAERSRPQRVGLLEAVAGLAALRGARAEGGRS